MRNYFTLLKYSLINSFALNKLRKKDDLSKISFSKVILAIFIVLIIFFFSLSYVYMFGEAFYSAGEPELILNLGILFGILMSLLLTVSNATGFLFKSKDFDMIMSLPIKSKIIVFSKISYLLLINYTMFIFIYIPTLIVYFIFVPTTLLFWVLALITFFLAPLLPVAIATVLAYFLAIIIPKFRYKNLLTIIFSLIMIVLIMLVSFRASFVAEEPEKFVASMKMVFSKTGKWAYNGIRGNYLDYLYFALISIIPFYIFTRFIGLFYLKANTKYSSSTSKGTYQMKDLKISSPSITLMKKELKRFFNSPMYVLNTIMGPLISSVFIVGFNSFIGPNMEEIGISLGDLSFLPLVVIALLVFTLGITSTTSSSISIEGKQFWILKSSPITPNQVFRGKVFVNIVITLPFILFNTIYSIIVFDFKLIDFLMIFMIPFLFILYISYLGLYINLLFPRFDYETDVKAVKQSTSVLLTLAIGFVSMLFLTGIGAFVLLKSASNLITYLASISLVTFMLIGIILLSNKHGSKVYKQIII